MTFSAFVGVCLTLAFVLGLVAITMRLLRRVSMSTPAGRRSSRITLDVVQRIPLGPRQGIAVVKIGEQLVAVSVGEGGVRPILEIETTADEAATEAVVPTVVDAQGFAPALLSRLRQAGLPLLLAAAVLGALPHPSFAQQTTAATQSTGATQTSAARAGAGQQSSPPARASTRPTVAQPATVPLPQAPGTTSLDRALGQALPSLDLNLAKDGDGNGLRMSGSVGIVIMLGLLTLLPSLILMMTSFTRILIVLNFVKQALGTQNSPPGQLVAALALILTGFVMAPTVDEVNTKAITPWLDGRIEQGAMMKEAIGPMREFMLRQVRERDLATFVELSNSRPTGPEDVSTVVLMSAFVTSELRTAFQLGFVLFLPFIVIDVVVSSVLMSMGMFMLPPAMISLPFKLLLFVLVDGWSLLIQSLVQGFR
ncbi:MAG: flagellar type III secretion system pore protein FliP [Gemmatimonadaceae bacterium]|nr:flagellar type III secretion system pore protein FliP [Gemmatimonadaceae bacterium]